MRVIVWPAGDDASAWYRMRFPAQALAAQGEDVTVAAGVGAGPIVQWDRPWRHLAEPPAEAHVVGLAERPDADVVVINRPARAQWCETIPLLQAAGIRVVVDVDDDFASIPQGNSARTTYDERRNPRSNRQWIERACLLADLVTVSTPDLARRYAPHGRVAVLPNLVPARYLDVKASEPLPGTIGWSGSVATHPGDLEATGGAVRDVLAERDGWSVRIVGTGNGVAQRLRVADDAVSSTGKWLPFDEYPVEMARMAIGIVPLASNRFNRSKSALKMSELAALGVPVVASPTPDNTRLHRLGVGLLAKTPAQWRAHLHALTIPEMRAELAAKGRAVMATQTYEQWADLWACAWESTLKRKAVA